MDIYNQLIVLIVGLVSGTFGAIIGSSLLLIVPVLIFLGVPVHTALGTGKLSALFRDIVALRSYHKGRVVDYSVGFAFTIVGIIGTVIGAFIALELSEAVLKQVVSICMLLIALVVLKNPGAGLQKRSTSESCPRAHPVLLPGLLGLPIGIYAGVFGGGVNLFIIFTFVLVFKHDFLTAVATSKVSNILFIIAFVIIFGLKGQIDYGVGVPLIIGMSAGGVLGSRLALARGNAFIRWLFLAAVLAMAVKLLFS